MTFKEKTDAIIKKLSSQITGDTPAEKIEEINSIVNDVKELEKDHNNVVEDKRKITEKYISVIDNYGTDEAPSNDDTPKTLEEIAAEVVAKREKAK